ncbi:hypothetical protein PFISCL1PPCAC_21674, partial [Pristionchus fissidentatus]
LNINRNYNWNNYPEGEIHFERFVKIYLNEIVLPGFNDAPPQARTYSRADPCTPWMRLMGRCPVQQSWYYPKYDATIYTGA